MTEQNSEPEFIREVITLNENYKRINEIDSIISDLKDKLQETDYQAIKYSEGWISEEDYQGIKELRQSYRSQINLLQEELESYDRTK